MRNQLGQYNKRSRLLRLQMAENKRLIRQRRNNELLGSAILGFFFALIVMSQLKPTKITSPEPLKPIIKTQAVEVTPTPKPFCKDAISCIRDIGEKQGRSNKTIMTMIRIAQKESHMNPLAKNKKSSARGLFQIIAGTWYSNDCVGDKYDYKDNITCAYKILDGQGLYAWEVCNNHSAKCF